MVYAKQTDEHPMSRVVSLQHDPQVVGGQRLGVPHFTTRSGHLGTRCSGTLGREKNDVPSPCDSLSP